MLSDKEKKKYNIIEKLENGEITRKEAKYESGLSFKQIDRLRIVLFKFLKIDKLSTYIVNISSKVLDKIIKLY